MLTGTLNKLKVVAIAAVTLVVLTVVLQNTQAVETHLLFLTLTMPNAALLFGTLIIGFAIGVVKLGFEVDGDIPVHRDEVWQRMCANGELQAGTDYAKPT